MQIIKDEILKNLDVSVALMILDDSMLERIIEDPAQPLIDANAPGFSREENAMYDTKTSLIDMLEEGKARGAKRIDVSYDFFFGGDERKNYPDSELTVKAYKIIHDLAKKYGMGFSASIASPLDTGGGYVATHETGGRTMQYKEGKICPDGSYEVNMDYQTQWTNNKGPMHLKLKEVKVFAFHEERIGDTPYFYVDENAIEDISKTAQYQVDEDSISLSIAGYGHGDIRIWGCAKDGAKNRCLVVLIYDTLEIDYFAEDALKYMKSIIDLHADSGITYEGFYSDEMHIQFDWDVITHFAGTEVNTRYMTDAMAKTFARMYGDQYEDFTKYLVYFAYKHHGFLEGEEGEVLAQHVFGKTQEDIVRTWQFRKRYYDLLHRHVVDLCKDTKTYAEDMFDTTIMTTGHSTWQECPTADRFYGEQNFSTPWEENHSLYDYTPEFVWSASIRENMSACHDHFKWGEYLCCIGTDIPEGGFLDRNYYGAAFTSGLAAVNRFPMAYYCIWGSPDPVKERVGEVGLTFGHYANYYKSYEFGHNLIQGYTTRISDILTVCPMDLNSVEERFGTWMVQYGYTDYITEERLMALVKKPQGACLEVGRRSYHALVVSYAPLMQKETLELIKDYVEHGGKVLWCSSPALLDEKHTSTFWKEIFGIKDFAFAYGGTAAKDAIVTFSGMKTVKDMTILTDFRPDMVYPVIANDASVAATIGEHCVGTIKNYAGGGMAVYMGFRPRDDQSCSMGEDIDTLFSILKELGCYTPNGCEVSSRPADSRYIYNRFPNGTVSLANHSRNLKEHGWQRTFYRNEEKDREFMKNVPLPSRHVSLHGEVILGHKVTFEGEGTLSYRYIHEEGLLGLVGKDMTGITIDGNAYVFSNEPVGIAWYKLDESNLNPELYMAYAFKCDRPARVTLPFDASGMTCELASGYQLNTTTAYPFAVENGVTVIDVSADVVENWMVFYK